MFRIQTTASFAVCLLAASFFLPAGGQAQTVPSGYEPLTPGEMYHTKFSGTIDTENADGTITSVIDPAGTVGEIIDPRYPGRAPDGSHWIDIPKRAPLSAADVGQVFGIALDDGANVYLTATSAFGLHLNSDGTDWMQGLWGPNGSPGAVYRLDATNGYAPSPFAEITLDGRANSGASLGNIAYDRWNQQFFVSDLETGMIHRLALSDGADLGHYDHGVEGRVAFVDATTGAPQSLPAVAFDPSTSARLLDCDEGEFAKTPGCWNFADFRRRVWGLGVRRDIDSGQVRLYYATWASHGFGNPDYEVVGDDEKTNAVWSIGLTPNGDFDIGDVRREFFLPDFQIDPEIIALKGYSNPVSDIAFPRCEAQDLMLVSERGGIKNLGLEVEAPFADPSESRTFLYERGENGIWTPLGRYDIGYYDRHSEGQPFLRANCAGGVDFAPAYNPGTWAVDLSRTDQFVWSSGDYLCSPEGPCRLPDVPEGDDSQVHGPQGFDRGAYDDIAPAGAYGEYPEGGAPYPPLGPDQSYLVDSDVLTDAQGNLIAEEFTRNDATKVGDVEIYQICEALPAPPQGEVIPIPVPRPVHTRTMTHRRYGSPVHTRAMTHRRYGSPVHTKAMTHRREGSVPPHTRAETHRRQGSQPPHTRAATHRRTGSQPPHSKAATHRRTGSQPPHSKAATHRRTGSQPPHSKAATHRRTGSQPPHSKAATHRRTGSQPQHSKAATHRRTGSQPPHSKAATHRRTGSQPQHSKAATHRRTGSQPQHSKAATHRKTGSQPPVLKVPPEGIRPQQPVRPEIQLR